MLRTLYILALASLWSLALAGGKRKHGLDPLEARAGHYTSRRALADILKKARDEGLPDAISRSTLDRDRARFCHDPTPYGPLVETFSLDLPNGPHEIGAAPPAAWLWHLCNAGGRFAALMHERLTLHPATYATPWNMIFYTDEVSPTDPLKAGEDTRETQAIYYSFAQLGQEALANEYAWHVLATVRSSICNKLDGGLSTVVRELLERYVFNPDRFHLAQAGVLLPFGRNPVPFHASFGWTLADEKALKQLWCCFGASGVRCCPLCSNVVSKRTFLREVPGLVCITCLDVAQMRLHTPGTLRGVLARLGEAYNTYSNTAYANLEKINGWHWQPTSLLSSPTLKLDGIDQMMFDWNHIYLCKGIFGVEVGR